MDFLKKRVHVTRCKQVR